MLFSRLERNSNSQHIVAAANDWQLPQKVPESLPELETSIAKPYGFLNRHSGYLTHVGHTENEVNDLGPDAENCSKMERSQRRVKREDEKWDPEHYMFVVLCRSLPSHILTLYLIGRTSQMTNTFGSFSNGNTHISVHPNRSSTLNRKT